MARDSLLSRGNSGGGSSSPVEQAVEQAKATATAVTTAARSSRNQESRGGAREAVEEAKKTAAEVTSMPTTTSSPNVGTTGGSARENVKAAVDRLREVTDAVTSQQPQPPPRPGGEHTFDVAPGAGTQSDDVGNPTANKMAAVIEETVSAPGNVDEQLGVGGSTVSDVIGNTMARPGLTSRIATRVQSNTPDVPDNAIEDVQQSLPSPGGVSLPTSGVLAVLAGLALLAIGAVVGGD